MAQACWDLWWEQITGPHTLIKDVGASLGDGKSLVLHLDSAVSWMDTMRDQANRRSYAEQQLTVIPWSPAQSADDIVPRLLDETGAGNPSICPATYRAQMEYILREHVFQKRVIWIVLEDENDLRQMAQFVAEYQRKKKDSSAMVLEVRSDLPLPHLPENLRIFRTGHYIRGESIRLFSSLLVDSKESIPSELREYAACVSANLAGLNAEAVETLLDRIDFQREEPLKAVRELKEQYGFELDTGTDPEKIVWKSQVQSVFAKIEMERMRIIDLYRERIREAMETEYWNERTQRSGYLSRQSGVEVKTPDDIELGSLVFMQTVSRNADRTRPLLDLESAKMRDWICHLSECRNNLAHHRICEAKLLFELLQGLNEEE